LTKLGNPCISIVFDETAVVVEKLVLGDILENLVLVGNLKLGRE